MATFKFHSDPGHGWLAVKRKLVDQTNIPVTPYSYQKGQTVYLEEDCDAPLFLRARKALGEKDQIIDLRASNNRSPIRSYESYKKE